MTPLNTPMGPGAADSPGADAPGWAAWRARLTPLIARWQTLQARERLALLAAAAVVGLFLLWTVGIQPALQTLREAPARLDALDADLQRMQRLAAEARDLRSAAPVSAAQASLALKSATDRLGSRGQLVIQGDRATLTLKGVDAEALRAWLIESRSAARARPVEMRLTQAAKGYDGTLVVSLGESP